MSLISISGKQLLLLLLKLFANLLSMFFLFSSMTLDALFLRVIQIQTSAKYMEIIGTFLLEGIQTYVMVIWVMHFTGSFS